MKGIVILDKPRGPTSNQISIWIKQLLNEKTAHSGTLDPNVTGVLPVLIGNTKILEFLQAHDKEYVCLMKTDKEIRNIEEILKQFEGKVYQRPPELSAVAKNIRTRKIYEIKLLDSIENHYLFSVYCQHGTYIRTLVEDIGRIAGTETEMLELRRISSGPFKENECFTLTELQDAVAMKKEKPELLEKMIKPLEYAVQKMPRADVNDKAVENIQNGADVFKPGLKSLDGHVVKDTPIAIFNNEKLIAMGVSLFDKKTIDEMKKGAVIKTKKVIK